MFGKSLLQDCPFPPAVPLPHELKLHPPRIQFCGSTHRLVLLELVRGDDGRRGRVLGGTAVRRDVVPKSQEAQLSVRGLIEGPRPNAGPVLVRWELLTARSPRTYLQTRLSALINQFYDKFSFFAWVLFPCLNIENTAHVDRSV